MPLGILGKKVCMTHIFDKKGNAVPVTLINAGPCTVSQIKSIENSGYNAIQLAYLKINKTRIKKNNPNFSIPFLSKPQYGHLNNKGLDSFYHLKEFKVEFPLNYVLGQELFVSLFKVGEHINISGITIGKGNASNIKRNHFSRGPMTHGSKHHRLQGSLGAGTTPGRVFPGKKMPGRLGTNKCTIKNLEILLIDASQNLLIIKGCLPGKSGNLLNLLLKS